MLLTAVSRRRFSSADCRCDAKCCCISLRTTRNSSAAIASPESPATATTNLICSYQSDSAADTVVVARIEIGKWLKRRAAANRSNPSIGLIRRIVPWSGPRQRHHMRRRYALEIHADHGIDVRIARQHGSVAVEHRDRCAGAERKAGKEILEIGRFDAPADGAEKLAVRPGHLGGRSSWSRTPS